MIEDKPSSLMNSAKSSLYGTSLSRILGMVRDMCLAFFFGSSPDIAAFMVAYRFANLLRRLLGEGLLQAGFVPHFESIRQEGEAKAFQFFRDFFFSFILLLLGVVVIGEGILFLVKESFSQANQEITFLTMIQFPGLIFICLYALNTCFLQCQKAYFLPAFAPALFNLTWIAAVILVKDQIPQQAVIPLSIGVVVAFFAQWLFTMVPCVYYLKKSLNIKNVFSVRLFSDKVRSLFKPLALTVFGISAMQINSAVDAVFARLADPSGPAYLWYAIRLQQLPLALFGIAIAGALLPTLSRSIQQGSFDRYRSFLQMGLKQSMGLMLICTFGIFILGGSSLNLIYGRGDFDQHTLIETLYCLWGYGIGLLPATFVLLLATGFYAKKNYKVPAFSSVAAVLINVFLNAFFIFGLGYGASSVAFATSISSFFNCFILFFYLSKKVEQIFDFEFLVSFFKSLTCSVLGLISTIVIAYWIKDPILYSLLGQEVGSFPLKLTYQFLNFVILAGPFLVVSFFSAYLIKNKDITSFLKKI